MSHKQPVLAFGVFSAAVVLSLAICTIVWGTPTHLDFSAWTLAQSLIVGSMVLEAFLELKSKFDGKAAN